MHEHVQFIGNEIGFKFRDAQNICYSLRRYWCGIPSIVVLFRPLNNTIDLYCMNMIQFKKNACMKFFDCDMSTFFYYIIYTRIYKSAESVWQHRRLTFFHYSHHFHWIIGNHLLLYTIYVLSVLFSIHIVAFPRARFHRN